MKKTEKNKKLRTIGLAYNLKKKGKSDEYEEYDEIETIEALVSEIKKNGYEVKLYEQDEDFLEKIGGDKPQFVFNIAEGKGKNRSRESQVPCVLESLNIPYSGSDPIAMGITLDKYLTSTMLRAAGVPVPDIFIINNADDIGTHIHFFHGKKKYIVKPRWEGSSKGIFLDSIVDNFDNFSKKTKNILSMYKQPAVVEEFVDGDEVTVGLYGNNEPKVLGMMKITGLEQKTPYFVYSIENKRDWREKIRYDGTLNIARDIRKKIEKNAKAAFKTLELRDVARIDFRIDKKGTPRIIDVNPLPGLSPHYSDLPIMYRLNGGKYSDLIKKILTASLKRCGF